MKTLILYYSYTGNTKKIAEIIQKNTNGVMEEIYTTVPYTRDYNAVVNQGQKEVNQGYMPEIDPIKANLAEYDTIFLGMPVWWYTFAPAVKTFLARYCLKGKKLVPFVTNGGWIGHTVEDIVKACPQTAVKEVINIHFEGNKLSTPKFEIENWIKKVM